MFPDFLFFEQIWWFVDTTLGCAVKDANLPMVVSVDARLSCFVRVKICMMQNSIAQIYVRRSTYEGCAFTLSDASHQIT
jgi:hypothetical protein